jgi:hypothetical protein
MGVPFAQVWWTDSATGSSIEISDAIDWTAKRGVSIKSNLVEISINNIAPDSGYSQYFDSNGNIRFSAGRQGLDPEEADDIRIYAGTAPVGTATTADLIMACAITGVEQNMSEETKSIKLNCSDKTFILLNQYAVGNYGPDTVPNILKSIIRQWTRSGQSSSDVIDVDTYVGTALSSGAAFASDTTYSVVYKPLYEVVEELSQVQYTGDTRPFVFWMDESEKLHWIYPSQTASGTISELTTDIYDMKITKTEKDEVNMIIYDCGKDKNNVSIQWYKFNFTSDSSKLKVVYQNWTEITKNMQAPLSTYWSTHDNDEVRAEAKNIANAKCDAYFSNKGMKWKGNMTLRGTKDYTAGDLITLTTPTFGFINQKLRVMDVSHDIDSNGWTTKLELEEDPLEMPIA